MAAVTLQKLIDRARAAADVQDDFVSLTEWTDWANVERLKLETFLLRVGYVLRENTASLALTGASAFEVTDPLAVLAVYEVSNGRWRRLRPGDLVDGPGGIDTVTTGHATMYRVIQQDDGTIYVALWPNPTTGTYKVRVVTVPVPLAVVADTVNYPAGFEDLIVLGMARRALSKEETVNPILERHFQEARGAIEDVAAARVFSGHQAIRNVDRVERGWSTMPQASPHSEWYIL